MSIHCKVYIGEALVYQAFLAELPRKGEVLTFPPAIHLAPIQVEGVEHELPAIGVRAELAIQQHNVRIQGKHVAARRPEAA